MALGRNCLKQVFLAINFYWGLWRLLSNLSGSSPSLSIGAFLEDISSGTVDRRVFVHIVGTKGHWALRFLSVVNAKTPTVHSSTGGRVLNDCGITWVVLAFLRRKNLNMLNARLWCEWQGSIFFSNLSLVIREPYCRAYNWGCIMVEFGTTCAYEGSRHLMYVLINISLQLVFMFSHYLVASPPPILIGYCFSTFIRWGKGSIECFSEWFYLGNPLVELTHIQVLSNNWRELGWKGRLLQYDWSLQGLRLAGVSSSMASGRAKHAWLCPLCSLLLVFLYTYSSTAV
jgi:hypothetical protein